MSNDSKPHLDSPRSGKATKMPPDDIWDQPELTPRQASKRIARMKKEGKLPSLERLQEIATEARASLESLKDRSK